MCSTSLCNASPRLSRSRGAGGPGAVSLLSLFLVAACSAGSSPITRVGVAAPRLEAVEARSMALHYRETGALRVVRFDETGAPDPSIAVTFSITGDSGGSALASGRAVTAEDGVTEMAITAGIEDATFRVIAASQGADDLVFDITVSRYPFVDVAVRLNYPGVGMGHVAQVRAILYTAQYCSNLMVKKIEPDKDDGHFASDYRIRSPGDDESLWSTIEFTKLPARRYAIVGRAEDDQGRVIARGCVDLLESQLGGGRIELPVPLSSVTPVLADAYQLESKLDLSTMDSPIEAWNRLGACPLGLAQRLLDQMVKALDPDPLSASLEAQRAPLDMAGCRPEVVDGVPTIDAQLYQLMWKQDGALARLPEVVADLKAIVSEAQLTSRFALTPQDVGRYFGSHALTQVTFHDAKGLRSVGYDPAAFGLPVTSLDSIEVDFDGSMMSIAEHGLTLRLPWLWGHALVDLALAPRALPTDIRPLLQSAVDVAMRQGPMGMGNTVGCAAIEGLLCKALGGNGPCPLAPACGKAVDALVTELGAPFIPAGGIDLRVAGRGPGIDANGDLVAEAIERGELSAVVGIGPMTEAKVSGTFRGVAAQIP